MQRGQAFESLTSQGVLLGILVTAAWLKHGFAVPPTPDYTDLAPAQTSPATQLADGTEAPAPNQVVSTHDQLSAGYPK